MGYARRRGGISYLHHPANFIGTVDMRGNREEGLLCLKWGCLERGLHEQIGDGSYQFRLSHHTDCSFFVCVTEGEALDKGHG